MSSMWKEIRYSLRWDVSLPPTGVTVMDEEVPRTIPSGLIRFSFPAPASACLIASLFFCHTLAVASFTSHSNLVAQAGPVMEELSTIPFIVADLIFAPTATATRQL